MKKEVVLVIILILATACTIGDPEKISTYENIDRCVSDCSGLGFINGSCHTPENAPDDSTSIGSCMISESEHCSEHRVCYCYCFNNP